MSEVPPVLKLNPKLQRIERQFLGKTPEELITDSCIKRIARKISLLLLQKEFNTDTVLAEIISTVREEMEAAFQDVIRNEKGSRAYYKGKKYGEAEDPLLRHLEKTMGADVQPEVTELSIDDDFPKSFSSAMNRERKTLDWLENAHKHPVIQNTILPLLQELSAFDKDGWHLTENGAQNAYNVIKPLAGDMKYAIPHNEAELLYILTYLPSSIRHPVQELLVHHSYIDFVQQQRAAAQEKTESTDMHDMLVQFLKSGIFSNSHWQRLSNYEGSSETMNAELAEVQILFRQTQKQVMDLAQNDPNHARVLQTFLEYAENLFKRIEVIHKEHGCYPLQQTDIGHGFRTHFLRFCYEALRPDSFSQRKRTKDGSIAAILEDDPHQMSNWKTLIQNHSSYSLPNDGKNIFETPSDDLLELSNSPDVRLFLIDIQNHDDTTAGIRVAEALVRKLVEKCKLDGQKKPYDLREDGQRTVVVWSTSPELITLARAHFESFFDDEDDEKEKYVSKSNGNLPIILDIRLKSDYLPFAAY